LHSPAWSQMEQSTGWLRRIISSTARWLSCTRGLLVWMTIPSAIGVWQAGTSFGELLTSTRHIRQLAAMERR